MMLDVYTLNVLARVGQSGECMVYRITHWKKVFFLGKNRSFLNLDWLTSSGVSFWP